MPPGVRERLVRVVAELLVLQLEHRAEEQAGSPGGSHGRSYLLADLHRRGASAFLAGRANGTARYIHRGSARMAPCPVLHRSDQREEPRPTGPPQALRDARRGRYELLLVFKVDRLARSTGGLARVLEELDSTGVAFRSASEPFDTSTAAGRMMVQMLGVFAEFEREMIVERTKVVLRRRPPAASGPAASLPTATTTTRTRESSFRTSKKRPTSAGSSSSTWDTSWEPPQSATG
jgi:hypothetical protein